MNFIEAIGKFTSSVSVVTAHAQSEDWGMTCTSVSVVSLEPGVVLWSIDKTRRSYDAFLSAEGYMVNVLDARQKDLALKFAQGSQQERFAGQSLVRGINQHPRLEGVIAWFDCRLAQVVSAGDHDILVGEVLDFGVRDSGYGLAYSQRTFGVLAAVDA